MTGVGNDAIVVIVHVEHGNIKFLVLNLIFRYVEKLAMWKS